jgi:mRNA interferase MazF
VSLPYPRGAVILVDLEPVAGSEQGRKRPCIVLSEMQTVRRSGARPLYFIVPLTTAGKLSGPLAPQLLARPGGLPADSTALVMHARAIDPSRIVRRWGQVDSQDVQTLQAALRVLVEQ